MKTRVAMLTHDEANAEARPYRVTGTVSGPYNGYVSIEYLDVYEYMDIHFHRYDETQYAGWGIYKIYTDADNDLAMVLRRVKPESEVADD